MALSQSDAAHFCRRIGFAGTTAEIAHFTGREVTDVVNEVLNLTPSLPSMPSSAQSVQWWTTIRQFREWWYQRMVDSSWVNRTSSTPSPLVEKLALFWHGHFACGAEKVEDSRAMFRQNNLFRSLGRGDFEDLVQDVSVSGAMIRYLDNESNVVGEEQENFARELMELHTTGVGHYTETDVVEVAKAWTGHGIVGWTGTRWDATYQFHAQEHDNSNKTIFGITQNWDGPDVVTELTKGSKQTATARYIAAKMWRFFVHDHPSASVINTLEAAFKPQMDIRDLLEAIFTHSEFWASSTRFALVRTPTEFVVDLFRRTQIPIPDSGIGWLMDEAGQELFEPPNVAGWGTNGFWLSTAMAWGKGAIVRHLRWQDEIPILFDGLESEGRTAAVNRIVSTLGIPEPSAATLDALGDWFDDAHANHRWSIKYNALVMGTLTPEFQLA